MKHAFVPALVAIGILLGGCGKSDELKKLEASLYGAVGKMHDDGMILMSKGSAMSGKLDQAIAMIDSLAKKYPKQFAGHNTDDLKDAKAKLDTATSSMKQWMADYKPYDENMGHEEVMAQLSKAKDGITKVKSDFQSALSAASTALENEKAFAEQATSKMAGAVKKVAKK
ncbi:MAG TPA: hypothetical protein VL126_15190 [Bacteroidota bacterium]|nr:hypothetical protein [Bacteroidota bacterium]